MKKVYADDGTLLFERMELEDLKKEYTQEELGKLEMRQKEGEVFAPNADYVVIECPVCGELCLGKDWHKHRSCFE